VRDRDNNDACFIISPVRFASKTKKNRKLRAIDGDPRKSYWHSEKGKIPLKGSKKGGYVQDFVHVIKIKGTDDEDDRVQRLGWRMKEYGLSTKQHGDSDLVLCKVYRTPRKPSTSTTPATPATPVEDVPVYSDLAMSSKKRKAADGDYPGDYMPSVRPRLAHEQPPMAGPALAENADAERYEWLRPVTEDERIRAAMPYAPDPKKDLDGFMKCLEEFLKKTVDDLVAQGVDIDAMSGKKKAPQPEPERDDSFFHCMEQEFPFLYPNDFVVTKEVMPAWAPADHPAEDVGMTRQCSDDVMLPWTSSTHMMY
jgi:hypothetical protein